MVIWELMATKLVFQNRRCFTLFSLINMNFINVPIMSESFEVNKKL